MKKIIIIKYGELSTKGDNLNYFIKKLKTNIESSLGSLDALINYDHGRMFIETNEFDLVVSKLKKVFGIHEFNVGYMLDTNDLDVVKEKVLESLGEFETFKVETKRSFKQYPMDSMEISRSLGTFILKSKKTVKVDVHNPDVLINVEIRKDASVFYFDKIKGLGGYPVGTQGKGLLMLSGGIDSPVAGYLGIKRGLSLDAVYFDSPPHTSEKAKDKVKRLAKVLKEYDTSMGMYVVNFTKMQETILKSIDHEYLITIMRRMMYRVMERIANKKKCHVIINGESIGQVASQTLTSMKAINEVVKIPVIRPVACFDKLEIIDVARKLGTYEISIEPFEDCCTIFVPKHPVINPDREKCAKYETMFDYDAILDEIMDNLEYINLKEENKFNDLL